MNLSTLTKITKIRHKRLGQGHGSGRGKTAGRGTKGQKARRNIPLYFEGGALPLIKRLPFMRGKGRNYSLKQKPVIINVGRLSALPKDTVIDAKTLIKYNLANESEIKKFGVKILGSGELKTALMVEFPTTKSAQEKIEKAGGQVKKVQG